MSTIIIGDIHGRPIWKQITDKHPKDEIIFVGDYFDSKDGVPTHEQIQNFKKILALKNENPERVTLLVGNHDYHYLPFADETYGGYQKFTAWDVREVLYPVYTEKQLQVCLQRGKFLISHAGFTKTWCQKNKIRLTEPVKHVNDLFYTKPEAFRFTMGKKREQTGDEPEQGPLWVRPHSLNKDGLKGFTQIVGHTQQPSIILDSRIICVDVLGFTPKYLEINGEGESLVRDIY